MTLVTLLTLVAVAIASESTAELFREATAGMDLSGAALIPQNAREVMAASDAVLLFGHAEPIGAPVVAYGPFVMNTREEIMQAIHDYQAGKFNAIPV